MKLQMKRGASEKINHQANEMSLYSGMAMVQCILFCTVESQIEAVEQHFRWEVLYNLYALHVGA
jgi:hypothetical protein